MTGSVGFHWLKLYVERAAHQRTQNLKLHGKELRSVGDGLEDGLEDAIDDFFVCHSCIIPLDEGFVPVKVVHQECDCIAEVVVEIIAKGLVMIRLNVVYSLPEALNIR